MSTVFLGLTAAIAAALLQSPALAGGRVRRGRAVPVASTEPDGIGINVIGGDAELITLDRAGALLWQTDVSVTVAARAAIGQDAEAAVDPLLQATWQRLAAMPVPPGVESVTLNPQVRWSQDEADTVLVQATLVLRITHVSGAATLAAV